MLNDFLTLTTLITHTNWQPRG